MNAAVPRTMTPATILAFHRSEVDSLRCIAERLVAGWSLASVVRLPSGGYLVRFNRPRKSAHLHSTQQLPTGHALTMGKRTNVDG